MKRLFALILACLILLPVVGCAEQEVDVAKDMTTVEFVKSMGIGINIGNTFDCEGDYIEPVSVESYETAWGSPVITKDIIKGYADAGFGVIRLPVTWKNLMLEDGTINPDLIKRVKKVVNWILEYDMKCILNSHHDLWQNRLEEDYDKAFAEYESMWRQLAEAFKDYDHDLMFESMNEVGFDKLWDRYDLNSPNRITAFEKFNPLNQTFVDIVRASGGNNATRHLLIAAYWTDISHACDPLFILPEDPADRFAVSVHYYTPPTFALLTENATWGKAANTWGTEAEFADLDKHMNMMKTQFVDNGIPVIVGEYSCPMLQEPFIKEPESVELYLSSVCDSALKHGLCPVLWDTPNNFFDRELLVYNYPNVVENMLASRDKYLGTSSDAAGE